MTSGFDQSTFFNSITNWFPDVIGCLGAIIVLVAYGLLQTGKLKSRGALYSFLNFLSAVLIIISLFYSWNLAAFIMEVAWMVISAFGMIKYIFYNRFRHKQYKA